MKKTLPIILFWGFWILLVIFLMAIRDTEPDLSVPDSGIMEDICPSGYPC